MPVGFVSIGGMIDVRRIATEREWDDLEGTWNGLVERMATPSVFLTFEWLRAWWDAYAAHVGAEGLHILVASEGGRVIGLAPLCRATAPAYAPGRLRCLRWIGAGSEDSDYLDFIIEGGREREVAAAFFDHLAGEPWDVIDLDLLRAGSPTVAPVREIAAAAPYRVIAEDSACTALDLPATWDDYLRLLRPRFRTKLRSLLRRLPAEHDASFDLCDDPATLAAELEELFRLHQARWEAAGEPGSFALPERRAFYQAIAARFLARGWLRFYRLRIAGRPAAYEFSFEHCGRLYYLQQGHEPELAGLSVGTALKAFVLRDCIERGVRAYDFLGDDADHKLAWGAERGGCVRLQVARPGSRTAWGLGVPRVVARIRAGARARAPEPLMRVKRRIHARLLGLAPARNGAHGSGEED